MEYSLPAWLGAFAGIVIGAIGYAVALGFIERRLRALGISQTQYEREAFERRLSATRRTILAIDIALCAAIGYWIGQALGETSGARF